MNSLVFLPLAEVPPLFGSEWLSLFVLLGASCGFVSLILTLRLIRTDRRVPTAAPSAPAMPPAPATRVTTPQPAPRAAAPTGGGDEIPGEIMALISAAVALTLGPQARIAAVVPRKPAVPMPDLLQQWSVEGRRQIYSSHQIR